MEQITKSFGEGAIMRLGDTHKVDVELIPSGALSLDILILAVVIQKAVLLRFMDQKVLVKQH